MTTTQLQAIKANILATPELAAHPNHSDGAVEISNYYAAQTSPAFIVWKSRVTVDEIGDNIVGTELAGLSTLNSTRLQTIIALCQDGVNPLVADRRAFFDDVFSGAGGVLTRAKLAILWKRTATRIEKLLATGTGTTASPAVLGLEGVVSIQDVQTARNLP